MRYTIDEIYKKKNKTEKKKKIVRIIIYIILIPILFYNIIMIIQSFLHADKIPSFLGYKSFVIVSGSMCPELDIGDIVVINQNTDQIKKGDIISFREGNSIITHRVDHVIDSGKRFITKGDANSSEDINPVNLENVEGVYSFKIPKIGKFILFMQNTTGVIIVAVYMIIFYIISKNKEEKIMMRKEKRRIYEEINNNAKK